MKKKKISTETTEIKNTKKIRFLKLALILMIRDRKVSLIAHKTVVAPKSTRFVVKIPKMYQNAEK